MCDNTSRIINMCVRKTHAPLYNVTDCLISCFRMNTEGWDLDVHHRSSAQKMCNLNGNMVLSYNFQMCLKINLICFTFIMTKCLFMVYVNVKDTYSS